MKEEASRRLALECRCRIMYELHASGKYAHYTTPRFPGKVLCIERGSEVPADCVPTEAQVEFWNAAAAETSAQAATG